MKLVLLCDDYWHPGVVPEKGLNLVKERLGAEIETVFDARSFNPGILKEIDVCIFAKSDNTTQSDETHWMSDSIISEFETFVAGGGGFVAIHSGTCYNKNPRMKAFLGGAFLSHPDQCPVRFDPVAKHPVTQGVEPFSTVDEHYQMDTLEGITILGVTSSVHNAQAAAWTKELGKGRIVVITPGHNIEMYEQPGMQALLVNAINYAANR